jgi:chemotaxis protein methyltransferase WspC
MRSSERMQFMDDGLLRLARTVCEEAGFSPEVVSDTMVSAALRRAMGASGMTVDGFERALSTDGKVRDALLEELLVRESWFWRDVRPFEWLGEHLRHRGWPARGHFRALSAPCANGEEAYSLALLCAGRGWTVPAEGCIDRECLKACLWRFAALNLQRPRTANTS